MLPPLYLVSRIVEIFLQFCLHFSEDFRFTAKNKGYADTCFYFSAGKFCIITLPM